MTLPRSKTEPSNESRGALALLSLLLALLLSPAFARAEPLDTAPRTAVVSAFEPEWLELQKSLEGREEHLIGGTVFLTGTIAGKPVVLYLSGISMVNAAMTTQSVFDHFNIRRLVFSGIAGGADPSLKIGDVVVPQAWSQYLESVFARETGGDYKLPSYAERTTPNFNMVFPQPVGIARGPGKIEKVKWFEADPALLRVAQKIEGQGLAQCTAAKACLDHQPRLIVGGKGVSGQAFVDNKAVREYAHDTFGASVIDMESAAVAHVAYANSVPFIAFRSLADLAGGGAGENEMGTFFQLASDNSATVVRAFLKALP
ncbi:MULTISPECIES: 5'-methylthioadenosine/S-adenosylhomocysteine nucleosidase [Rhodomicrobium]|uniref:5'-methylthioadenosine/S-adenosylhomocysteine nucleosidase n=1 Tax=Rhodomicrobium TaxID=1068 RepID=UPI000B4BCB40|nr:MULTISPECIES: 5'-methylthioadenosine/S-adenosylhomocysteine nucleosidase [Rhodomicrobium]